MPLRPAPLSYIEGDTFWSFIRKGGDRGLRDSFPVLVRSMTAAAVPFAHSGFRGEITGLSGLAILDAILAGERDPVRLASLCNGRVKSPRDKVAKSLEGDYRPEHLCALRQSLIGYRFYQKLIAEVDVELQLRMRELPRAGGAPEQMPPRGYNGNCVSG